MRRTDVVAGTLVPELPHVFARNLLVTTYNTTALSYPLRHGIHLALNKSGSSVIYSRRNQIRDSQPTQRQCHHLATALPCQQLSSPAEQVFSGGPPVYPSSATHSKSPSLSDLSWSSAEWNTTRMSNVRGMDIAQSAMDPGNSHL